MRHFRCLFVLFALSLLSSCVSTFHSGSTGLGGTGLVAEAKPGSGGIGGTGRQAGRPGQGGIGGTGKAIFAGKRKSAVGGIGGTGVSDGGLGGTGIVGTITGFGSIWVNDAHIHFNDDTPIRIDNQLVDKDALRLGQVVAVLSERVESDYQAHTIDVVHEVIGPVTVSKDKQLVVLGQLLELDSGVLLYDEAAQSILSVESLVDLVEGRATIAKVSGYRSASGSILASRVDIVSLSENQPVPFQVMGHLSANQTGVIVADLDLEVSPLLIPDDLSHRYMVSGFIDGSEEMVVEDIGVDSAERILEGASNFIVQGLAELDDFAETIELVGMEFAINEGLSLELVADLELNEELVQIVGDFEGENIFIEDFGYYSENVEEFVELLHDIGEEHFEADFEGFEFEGEEIDTEEMDLDAFEEEYDLEEIELDDDLFDEGFEFEDEFEYENFEDEEFDPEEFENPEDF